MYKTANHQYGGGIRIFTLMDLFNEMGLPISEKQMEESQSHVVPPIFAQARVGA